ncbi:MAG TPA: hypothetical protein VK533_04540 [Sphingomonas sp.]|uniref:hypothetical protein n=1 Tax=Sphingomonas sp. TaxID=28214 RepID=UPI002CFFE2CB|nr:hypothetical protein [Sphingomonas sp.]HMI18792.1 hypothetical protein [Sphingomonas sp.]
MPLPATSALDAPLAGVVAVVGCDGSGKTTLAADLVAALRDHGAVERRYMGLISGEMGDKIKLLPFIGVRLERHLAAKARRAQDMQKKLPGTFTAIVMYLLSVWRVAKVRRLIRLSKSGMVVIAERYPQSEIPGFHFDGPGLTTDRTSNWLVRKLALREQKLYDWMAEQRPALVIRLNVDADTAFARKPDHPLAELREKTETMPRIKYHGAAVHEIDSRLPYPQMLEAALQAATAVVAASNLLVR